MANRTASWCIFLYHDVSWEENCYIRALGGTCPPDVFRRHVAECSRSGDLVSVPEGLRRLQSGETNSPMFSFWFDDGLIGVRKYAAPILEEYKAPGAISICSRFVKRTEFFWRFKLAYLNSIDGMRFVRSRLRKLGFRPEDRVRMFTLDHFSDDVLACINELFDRFTTTEQRADAFRMFDTAAGIRDLQQRGWTIANHSAGHYPVTQDHSLDRLQLEFLECEREFEAICGGPSQFWVIPFDRRSSADAVSRFDEIRGDRWIVFVGDKLNTRSPEFENRLLHRVIAPWADPAGMRKTIASTIR